MLLTLEKTGPNFTFGDQNRISNKRALISSRSRCAANDSIISEIGCGGHDNLYLVMKEDRRYEITCPTLRYMIKCLKVSPLLLITYLNKNQLCLWVYLLKTEIDFNSIKIISFMYMAVKVIYSNDDNNFPPTC